MVFPLVSRDLCADQVVLRPQTGLGDVYYQRMFDQLNKNRVISKVLVCPLTLEGQWTGLGLHRPRDPLQGILAFTVREYTLDQCHTIRFKGMTEEESTPILSYLFKHQTQPEFCCSFRWKVGSVAFWDNRSTQHNPINDYDGYKRVMHRITIAGDRPF